MSKNKASSNLQTPSLVGLFDSNGTNCLWVAACSLGLAVFLGDGMGSPPAKFMVCISTFFAAIAAWKPSLKDHRTSLRVFLLIFLMAVLFLPVTRIPGYYLAAASQSELPIWLGLRSFAAVAGIACWFLTGRAAKVLFCACSISLFFAGYWTLRASPQPAIDVFFFFKTSIAKLWAGHNPYALLMPNIYGPGTGLYAQDLIQGDKLRFGFPYPLGSLVGPTIADILLGDYRLGVLFLYVTAAVWLGLRGKTDRRIALLALFFPRLEFIFEQGWSDAWSGALLLGMAVFARTAGSGFCAGLWIASKQYLIPFALPWIFDLPRHRVRSLICLGLATSLYLLPLVFKPGDYLWSVFGLQFIQPFRPDSLSFFFGPTLPAVLVAVFWLLGLPPRLRDFLSYPRFSPESAMGLLHWLLWAFFIFNKQAFANYFFTLYLLTLWLSGNYLQRRISP